MELIPTPSQTVGPFFAFGLTEFKGSVGCIAGPEAKGDRVHLLCRVLDGDNVPVPDAMIEIWQADADGIYNHPEDAQHKSCDRGCKGFGRMGTNKDGTCEFETIKPGRVPWSGGVMQAPHLNLALFARGMLKQLYTRMYFSGDPANEEDPILALVPKDRRETLIAQRDSARPNDWSFDIHMQGDRETVFFDV